LPPRPTPPSTAWPRAPAGRATWCASTGRSGGGSTQRSGDTFTADFSVSYQQGQEPGGTITIEVTARDPEGNSASAQTTIQYDVCRPVSDIE
jgi:hypothetical protein